MVACKSCGYGASDLRGKITIQRKTATADGMGGVTDAWADEASPWAMWKVLSGSELWAAQRISPMVKVKAVIRFKGNASRAPYYTIADRVTYKGREYSIVAVVDPDDGEQWLELMLAEGAAS
jgi:SPP1 family predicted phage head-tail adaptor